MGLGFKAGDNTALAADVAEVKEDVSELTSSLNNFEFGVDTDGNYGFTRDGAFHPFASATELYNALQYSGLVTPSMTFQEMCEVLAQTYPDKVYGVKNSAFIGGASYSSVSYSEHGSNTSIGTSGTNFYGTGYSTSSTSYKAKGTFDLNGFTFVGNGKKLNVEMTLSVPSSYASEDAYAQVRVKNMRTGAITSLVSVSINNTSVNSKYTLPNDGDNYCVNIEVYARVYTGSKTGSATYNYYVKNLFVSAT